MCVCVSGVRSFTKELWWNNIYSVNGTSISWWFPCGLVYKNVSIFCPTDQNAVAMFQLSLLGWMSLFLKQGCIRVSPSAWIKTLVRVGGSTDLWKLSFSFIYSRQSCKSCLLLEGLKAYSLCLVCWASFFISSFYQNFVHFYDLVGASRWNAIIRFMVSLRYAVKWE